MCGPSAEFYSKLRSDSADPDGEVARLINAMWGTSAPSRSTPTPSSQPLTPATPGRTAHLNAGEPAGSST